MLRPPERRPSRYRIYSESDLHRLQFILHAKTLGFTLEEIKHILQLRERQACPCREVRRIGEERLTELEKQIAELATWCEPCIAEIPDLNALHEKYAERGLRVLGIVIESGSVKNIRQFVTKHKIDYQILIAEDPSRGQPLLRELRDY